MAACSVCAFGYNQVERLPKVLKCGHTFCAACVTRLTTGVSQVHRQCGSVRCPTCRTATSAAEVKVNTALRENLPANAGDDERPVEPKKSIFKTAPDTTLSIITYWKIEDKDAFLRTFQRAKQLVKRAPGVKYYGFTLTGDVAVCKEGYANVASYLLHLRTFQDLLFEAMSSATMTNMEAHGPKEEVDKLEETLKDLLSSHWAYADGAFIVPKKYADSVVAGQLATDETLCVMVYWEIKDYAKFLTGVKDFQGLTKQEEKVRYYGFCLSGCKAICREAYDCAEGFLEHLDNVKDPLDAALQCADIVRVEVHGPSVEVDKLRKPLASFPAMFWSYPDDAFVAPSQFVTAM